MGFNEGLGFRGLKDEEDCPRSSVQGCRATGKSGLAVVASVDARLSYACTGCRHNLRPPPLEALVGVKNEDDFWTRFWSFPHGREGLEHVFLGKHHQRNWAFVSHIYVASRRKLGAQTGPMLLMMLALGGLQAA